MEELPPSYSPSAADFINKLLQRKCNNRLGKSGVHELKNHEWFHNFDWTLLEHMQMKSPLKPLNMNKVVWNINTTLMNVDQSVLDQNTANLFQGYEFNVDKLVKLKTDSTKAESRYNSENSNIYFTNASVKSPRILSPVTTNKTKNKKFDDLNRSKDIEFNRDLKLGPIKFKYLDKSKDKEREREKEEKEKEFDKFDALSQSSI